MIKYKADIFRPSKIEVVEVIKETKSTIWIKQPGWDRKLCVRKYGRVDNYFDTFQQAKEFLLEKSKQKLTTLNNEIRHISAIMAKIEKLEEE